MRRAAKALLAAALAVGAGASVFRWSAATSTPFAGAESATCGPGLTCSASSFTGTTATGSAITITSQLTSALDLGPGGCDMVGTNGSGQVVFGDGCTPTVLIGDSAILNGSNWTNNGGAINCDGACQIRDSGNGTLPINTTGGVVLNSTSAITGMLVVSVVIDLPSVAAAECEDVTATVAGVEANDFVAMAPTTALGVLLGNAYVSNAGTDEVTFRACNLSGGPEDPASATYRFWVVRKA